MWFIDLGIIIIFLVSSGFFSGIEIAFISADRLLVEVERQKGNKRGQILAEFLEHPSQFLGTTLVGNNIVLVFLSILASDFLLNYVGIDSDTFVGTIEATLITTVVVLIFGEFLPKVSFQINPTEILFAFAYPLRIISFLLKPLALIMIKSSNAIIQVIFRIPTESTEKAFNRKDLDHFINNINSEDDEIDTDLFQKVLFMHQIKVRDCMIPRNEIQGIEINQSIEELRAMFTESRLSRLLVYRDNLDYIEGYVHHQSLFEKTTSIKEMLWKIPMVHEFMPAQDVMNSLIKDKLNLAWVVDERGGTAGIIALEDILEEIFGEIADEHDEDEENLQINDHEFVFPGRSEIGVINEEFELDIPENEDYHTLSGLIVFNKEYIPEQKEIVILDNYKFIVEEVSSTRVEKVRVIKQRQEED
jgi:CBS domain containing-hemolysin-like protein